MYTHNFDSPATEWKSMYTKAELVDEFGPIDADECAEMRSASELGYSRESLAASFSFDEAPVRYHLSGCCSHH